MHKDWIALFAGNDVGKSAWPLLLAMRSEMLHPTYDLEKVQDVFSEVYTDTIQRRFLTRDCASSDTNRWMFSEKKGEAILARNSLSCFMNFRKAKSM